MAQNNNDLTILKVGLEHAVFADYRIRDCINDIIKNIHLDLDDIGFEPSLNTIQCYEALNSILSDIESPVKVRELRLDEPVIEGVVEKQDESETEVHNVVNVDEEIDEWIKS